MYVCYELWLACVWPTWVGLWWFPIGVFLLNVAQSWQTSIPIPFLEFVQLNWIHVWSIHCLYLLCPQLLEELHEREENHQNLQEYASLLSEKLEKQSPDFLESKLTPKWEELHRDTRRTHRSRQGSESANDATIPRWLKDGMGIDRLELCGLIKASPRTTDVLPNAQ